MQLDNYFKEIKGSKDSLYKFIIIVIGMAFAISSYYTYKGRVIEITMPPFEQKIKIGGSSADETYIRIMTRYITGLYLNYTPGNIRSQYSELLRLYDSADYSTAESSLLVFVDKVERAGVTSVFNLEKIEYLSNDNGGIDITISGLQAVYSKGQEIDKKNKRYILKSQIKDYRFYLKDISILGE